MKPIRVLFLIAVGLGFSRASGQALSDYQTIVSGQNPSSYFKLDGALTSAVDSGVTLEGFGAGAFAFDVFRDAGSSYSYVNRTDFLRQLTTPSLINGGGTSNITSTAAGSVTFLFRTLSSGDVTGQRYLFSAGSVVSNHNAFSLFIESTNVLNGNPGSLKLRFGNTTTTILPAASIAPSTWYYFAVTYLESRAPSKALWYVGRPGEPLLTGTTTNSPESVAGTGTGLYIGNKETIDAAYRDPGSGQLDEFAIWNRELSSAEVNAQFAVLPNLVAPPASAYQSIVTSQTPNYYFQLDGSLNNEVAGSPALTMVGPTAGFTYDYFGNFETTNAAAYTAANDGLVVNNNLVSGGGTYNGTPGTGAGTISFLFSTLSGTNHTGQRFLFSAGGATGATNAFGLLLENWTASVDPGAIKIRLGNASKTILPAQSIVPGDWYYCALSYDESVATEQVHWYVGQPGSTLNTGVLTYTNGIRAGQGNVFIIGNHTNFNGGWRSPGTGRIDEFAIWHRILSPTEITNQFSALTPTTAVVPPKLTVTRSKDYVIISWPVTAGASFVLEATNVLNATTTLGGVSWPSAGVPTQDDSTYFVTDPISTGKKFYRLRAP